MLLCADVDGWSDTAHVTTGSLVQQGQYTGAGTEEDGKFPSYLRGYWAAELAGATLPPDFFSMWDDNLPHYLAFLSWIFCSLHPRGF